MTAVIQEDSDAELSAFEVDFEWKEVPQPAPVPLPIPAPIYKCIAKITCKAKWPTGELASAVVNSSLRPVALYREPNIGDFNKRRSLNFKVQEVLGTSKNLELRNGARVQFTLELVTQTSHGHDKLMEGPGGVGVLERVLRTLTETLTLDIDAPPVFVHPGVDVDPLPHEQPTDGQPANA